MHLDDNLIMKIIQLLDNNSIIYCYVWDFPTIIQGINNLMACKHFDRIINV